MRSLALSLVKMMELLQMRKCREPLEEKALLKQFCNLSALVLYSQNQIVPAPTDKQGKMEREIMVLNIDDIFTVPQWLYLTANEECNSSLKIRI